MKYRDILGFSKSKKKVIKEQSKPKKTVLDGVKQELNEWHNQPPTEKRWSGAYGAKDGLTEYERRITEVGAAPLYRKHIKKIDKFEKAYHDAIEDFELFLYKKKGLKKEAALLNASFHGYVGKFLKVFDKLLGKLL